MRKGVSRSKDLNSRTSDAIVSAAKCSRTASADARRTGHATPAARARPRLLIRSLHVGQRLEPLFLSGRRDGRTDGRTTQR